jgi:Holliday junction resolvase RusA-like endonuclease
MARRTVRSRSASRSSCPGHGTRSGNGSRCRAIVISRRPDLDNLVKAVLDALNGLAWRDDAQIHTLHISKVVAAGDEQPHVQVRIAQEAWA